MKHLPQVLRTSLLLLPLVFGELFAQSPHPTEEPGLVEMKRQVIDLLRLSPGATVADVGCGDGFYTIPLARRLTPKGKIFAVDIDETALSKLRQRLAEEGLKNVQIIKGADDNPKLPAAALDGALIVNAYHEMKKPEPMLRRVLAALKPGAVLVLVEGIAEIRENASRDEQIKHHELAPPVAKRELEAAGFEIVEIRDPVTDRPHNIEEKSRWWAIIARRSTKSSAAAYPR